MIVITDLDNTLYDWVTFFAKSFDAMVSTLVRETGLSREIVLNEFKAVHLKYHNSEHPFAILELPSVRSLYPDLSREDLLHVLDPALHAFNSQRNQSLRLYDDVYSTLDELHRLGVVIVGHTEATLVNALFRLRKLDILKFFYRIYALESPDDPHPIASRQARLAPPINLVRVVSKEERKPNPKLLWDICKLEGKALTSAIYVGDSLTRDISMAREANLKSAWAKYGTDYDPVCWDILVRITHWTPDDVKREELLRAQYAGIKPDYVLSSFSELLPIVISNCGRRTVL